MSRLSVDEVSARLAQMWKNFSSDANGLRIETAFAEIPRVVYPAHLPCVIIFPGRATYTYDEYGEEVIGESREYRSQLMTGFALFGNEESNQPVLEPYFTKVQNYFAARPGLEDDTQSQPRTVVARARITGDGGYFIAEFPGGLDGSVGLAQFHATDFTHVIETFDFITYKD